MKYSSWAQTRGSQHSAAAASLRAGRDRWLISYADLVTLLFACFTVAYAAAHVSKPSEAPPASAVPAPLVIAPPEATPSPPAKPAIRDVIAPIVVAALGSSHVELIEDKRGLVISLPESAAFAPGSAALTAAAEDFLLKLSGALAPTSAVMRIEGHTDDVPLTGGRYATNWELSTARASAVVLFLVDEASFEPARLSAAGYGEFHPRESNDTAEHRARNRRVDVVVVDARASEGIE